MRLSASAPTGRDVPDPRPRRPARYPSGLGGRLPDDQGDVRAWLAQVCVFLDTEPLGSTAPCLNPECCGPVDRLPRATGPALQYCSSYCKNRARDLRRSAEQQLDVLTRLEKATAGKQAVPRQEIHERIAALRWWLIRLRDQ